MNPCNNEAQPQSLFWKRWQSSVHPQTGLGESLSDGGKQFYWGVISKFCYPMEGVEYLLQTQLKRMYQLVSGPSPPTPSCNSSESSLDWEVRKPGFLIRFGCCISSHLVSGLEEFLYVKMGKMYF